MNKFNQDFLTIAFCSKDEEVLMHEIKTLKYSKTLETIAQNLGCKQLIVLDQTHSNIGYCVETLNLQNRSSWFEYSGDFLITNSKDIALVVLTADCTPIIIYDPIHQCTTLVHSGWKGTYANIMSKAIEMMQQQYQTKINDLLIYFGPSARNCCYQVSNNFYNDFKKYPWANSSFIKKNENWYFDNINFLKNQVFLMGVPLQNISTQHGACTICSTQFCSFRREQDKIGRQATIVKLN